MKLAIFGLAASSSWGNGHALLWRSMFFVRNVPYYAQTRDQSSLERRTLVLCSAWNGELPARITDDVLMAGSSAAAPDPPCRSEPWPPMRPGDQG